MDWTDSREISEICDDRGLRVTNAAVHLIGAAVKVEPEFTSALTSAAGQARIDGLQYRVKSPDSLARKIASRRSAGDSLDDVAGQITDILRSTVVAERSDQVAATFTSVSSALESQGWAVSEIESSFVAGNPYKGLHFLVSKDGVTAEMQVHTEQTMAIKLVHHADYEISRDPRRSEAERAAAWQTMVDAWAEVEHPDLSDLDGVEQKRYGGQKA